MSVNELGNGPSDAVVSVIVPVYNAGRFLCRCVESVTSQSYRSIEIILVNDGSTDDSEAICNRYAQADNRIKVVSRQNSGPAAARNAGVARATGTFVFFLDADDYIHRNALEILVTNSRSANTDLVMGNFGKLSAGGDFTLQRVAFCPDNVPFDRDCVVLSGADVVAYVCHFLKHPSNHLISYCWGRLYKLSVIREHNITANEKMRLFEDFVFNLEYLRHTREVVFVNKALYTYVMHDSHVSASMAIVNGDSLLHDMNVFKTKAGEFIRQLGADVISAAEADRAVGHALVHYTIISMIRSCRLIAECTRKMIRAEFGKIVNAPIMRESLKCYSPVKGNTRLLPWLMTIRMVDLIMLVGRYKAYKRYGKPEGELACQSRTS